MTKLLAQHGAAKGQKIEIGMKNGNLFGSIFSINDETFESIKEYVNKTDVLNKENVFLDPQLYYSVYDESIFKKIAEIESYPKYFTRRDWRNKTDKIINYIDYHSKCTSELSSTLITPGFLIDKIDWCFDYSIEIYKYCIDNYQFDHYALSLLIHSSFLNNSRNVEELLAELDDLCERKDYVYLTICHDNNNEANYEEIDSQCLANILSFVYGLKKREYKIIMGYSFMNSVLFAMLDCEFVASGWFNTLRKFQKNKFELNDNFGRRKKRYTSLPLLSYIMFDDVKNILGANTIKKEELLSGTRYDETFIQNEDSLSYVDLEHQYWESLNNLFKRINSLESIQNKVKYMLLEINNAMNIYSNICKSLYENNSLEEFKRIKTASKHLLSWKVAIELFKNKEIIDLNEY